MKQLLFFLFGIITTLTAGIYVIDKYADYVLDENILEMFYTTYWQYYYQAKLIIVTLFIFSILIFVFSLGKGHKNGYEEIRPE